MFLIKKSNFRVVNVLSLMSCCSQKHTLINVKLVADKCQVWVTVSSLWKPDKCNLFTSESP